MLERCRHARALDATLALAKANTASSSPILQAASFRRVATERRYVLKTAARDTRVGNVKRPPSISVNLNLYFIPCEAKIRVLI